MNDKYKLLQENPQFCKRLFGIDFVDFENILGKMQIEVNRFLEENPISNRGLDSDFSLANRLLLTLEYLRQYRSGGPPDFLEPGLFLRRIRELCKQALP